MVKNNFQIQIKPPPEDDHHCSVSEAGGDDDETPKGVASSKLGGFKAGMVGKLSSIRSGVSKIGSKKKGGESDGASSDVASSALRSSLGGQRKNSAGLTEEQLQAHGGASGQITQYVSTAPSNASGTRVKSETKSYAEGYSSYYSTNTSMSHETSGPVYGKANLRENPSQFDDEEPLSPRIWPPPHPDRKVHIRRRKFAAGFSLVSFWTLIVSGALFAYIWRYFIVEVDEVQGFVAAAAMKQVQVRTEALLAPAFSVVRSLNLAMKMGSSPMDYHVLHKLLAPQFQSSPVISEVHLTEASTGSVLVQPGTVHVDSLPESQRSLLFRSDRLDCNDIARSCALQPMKANVSDWYLRGTSVEWKTSLQNRAEEEAFTLPVTWHGPSFLKGSSYATAWDVYYWNPAYSLVSKLSWSSSMVLRVVLNANGLQDVVREAEQRSKGSIFICTESGQVLSAADMSQAVQVDVNTGSVNFRHIWEMEQTWTSLVSEGMLAKNEVQDFFWGWVFGTRVFMYPFEISGSKNLGLKLRIVLAVPRSALALQWLEILSPVCAIFGVLPSVTLFSYLFIKWVSIKQVQMREKRERRRREFLEEKELQAKVKAERMGKLKNAGARLSSKLPGKGKKKAKK
jgi:hypothetical protein